MKKEYGPNCHSLESYYDQELEGKRIQKNADMILTHKNGEEEVVEVKPIWESKSEKQLKRDNIKKILEDYKKLRTLNFISIKKKYLVVPYLGVEEYRPIIFRRAVLSIFPHTKLGYKIVLITC